MKRKIKKKLKIVIHTFQNIAHLLVHTKNFASLGLILVNFLRIFNVDQFSKNKNRKIVFILGFRTLRIFLDQEHNLGYFERGGGPACR